MQKKPILLEKVNGKWELYTHRIRFVDKGNDQEVYTSDVAWYENFSTLHEGFELTEVVPMQYTEKQLERLSEIETMDIADTVASEYVMEGIIGDGLEILELKRENKELKQLLADLTEVVLLGGAS